LAWSLLDKALAMSPCSDQALELQAGSAMFGRHKDVADMLQDHTPNFKMANASRSDSCVVDQLLFERFFDLTKFVIHITIYLLLKTVSLQL